MNTNSPLKIADKVIATIAQRGFKKKVIAEQIGMSRQTFDTRLKKNSFENSEIAALERLGLI